MTNLVKKTSILLLLIFACSGSIWAQKANLTINVNGFKSNKGTAVIYIFNAKKGFPSDNVKALKVVRSVISNDKCTVSISELEYGEYAISVLHDENSNGKLDTNFLGMPKEGIGVSNNPDGDGPPSYNDAKFSLKENNKTNTITIKYL